MLVMDEVHKATNPSLTHQVKGFWYKQSSSWHLEGTGETIVRL